MNEREIFDTRIALIREYLIENKSDGILLSRVDNFAMATGGKRNYVNIAGDMGAASLFVGVEGQPVLFADAIEMPRLVDEEVGEFDLDTRLYPWFEGPVAELVTAEFKGDFVSDDGRLGRNVHDELRELRALLTTGELEKYRALGRLAASAMEDTIARIERGMTEQDVAGLLVSEGAKRGLLVPVHLIAADDRIAKYRHPLPTLDGVGASAAASTPVARYVMVVGGFQRDGLSVSITRFKSVDDLPADLLEAYDRICCVDAAMQEATVPGKTLSDVLDVCIAAYREFGFAENEWHNHHQGGTTGYGARTCKAAPGELFPVLGQDWASQLKTRHGISAEFGQAFAWNPSAPGVKSEDTFLLWPDGHREIISKTPGIGDVDLASAMGRATDVVKSCIAG